MELRPQYKFDLPQDKHTGKWSLFLKRHLGQEFCLGVCTFDFKSGLLPVLPGYFFSHVYCYLLFMIYNFSRDLMKRFIICKLISWTENNQNCLVSVSASSRNSNWEICFFFTLFTGESLVFTPLLELCVQRQCIVSYLFLKNITLAGDWTCNVWHLTLWREFGAQTPYHFCVPWKN